jgi:DNA polymerase-3 subunit delta
MDSKLLNRELAQNILTTVYLFVAEDEYIAQSYLQLIKERFIVSFPELNITEFEDKNIRASDVLAACTMLPIMAEKRLVVVKEQTFKNKETAEGLVKYMQHPSPNTVLILYCGQVDKRTSVYKTAQKTGKIVEFSKLNHSELLQWIRTDVAKNKTEIDADAVEYLIKQSGYLNRESKIDLGYCRNELDKLILYDPKAKKISLETVQKVVSVEAN